MRPIYLVLIITALVACRSVDETKRANVAKAVFSAATTMDSAALRSLTVDSLVLARLGAIRASEPELLQALAFELKQDNATSAGDSVRAIYRFAYRSGRERVAVGFVQRSGTWLVYHIGFPDRQ